MQNECAMHTESRKLASSAILQEKKDSCVTKIYYVSRRIAENLEILREFSILTPCSMMLFVATVRRPA
jgi:hypothetical protein